MESPDSLEKRRQEAGEGSAAGRKGNGEMDEREAEGKTIDMEMGCVSEGGSQRCKTEQSLT